MDYQNTLVTDVELIRDLESELPVSAMLAMSSVPYSHRRIADNYSIIKKICGFQISQPRIENFEKNMLKKYKFSMLEETTIEEVNEQLLLLKQWSLSGDDVLREASDELLRIRVKELKFIISTKYACLSNELLNGYKAMELYLTQISKFYSMS